jgi:hypothetical protein
MICSGLIEAIAVLMSAVIFPVTFLVICTIYGLGQYFIIKEDVNNSLVSQPPHLLNGTNSYETRRDLDATKREQAIILTSAVQLVNFFLTLFDMAFGHKARLFFDGIALYYLSRSLLTMAGCRWQYGAQWRNAAELEGGVTWSQKFIANCACALFQAFMFGGTMSQHLLRQRLWNGLCGILGS